MRENANVDVAVIAIVVGIAAEIAVIVFVSAVGIATIIATTAEIVCAIANGIVLVIATLLDMMIAGILPLSEEVMIVTSVLVLSILVVCLLSVAIPEMFEAWIPVLTKCSGMLVRKIPCPKAKLISIPYFRGRDPRYDLDPRGLPPAYLAPPLGAYDIRPRSPVHFGGPAPGARMIDPAIAGGRAPPVAGYAASAYYAGNVGGAPGNVDRDRERERDPRDPRASGGERGGRVDDRDSRGSARDAPGGGRGGPLLQPRY